ncbi:hypothetical protein MMC12_000751 [Toensbergia leucococca]|nr:hypothetical protein [Toensbergia leucococca]
MIRVASSWNHGNILKTACLLPQPLRLLTTQPGLLVESSKDDQSEARRWLATFNQSTIPRSLCQITFSRSSGPGGQNVNKVNSKATVRVEMKDLLPLIPGILHQELIASRYYAERGHALVIQADGSRKQGDNVQECFKKLQDLVISAGKSTVTGETSLEQVKKVKRLWVIDRGCHCVAIG